jgi:hypothetical protein
MMRLADFATASTCEYCGSVAERGVVGFKCVGIFLRGVFVLQWKHQSVRYLTNVEFAPVSCINLLHLYLFVVYNFLSPRFWVSTYNPPPHHNPYIV